MTDEFEDENNSDNQDERLAAHAEAIQRYAAYLSDRGMELEAHREEGMSTREYENRLLQEMRRRQFLFYLQYSVELLDKFARSGMTQFEIGVLVAALRLNVIEELFLIGEWLGPFEELVNQELPGEEPTSEQYRQFSATENIRRAKSGNWILQALAANNLAKQMLSQYNLSEEENDLAIWRLISMHFARGHRVPRDQQEAELWDRVRTYIENPQHPVWKEIIEMLLDLNEPN